MFKIAKAQKADLDQICQLFKEYDKDIEKHFPKKHLKLIQEQYPDLGDSPKRRKAVLQAVIDKKELFLVAKENNKIIGCVIGWIEPDAKVGKFDQLILSSRSKKQEILEKLYQELEKWFKAKKCTYIIVDVLTKNPRKRLYEKFGFEPILVEMRKII